MNGHNATLLKRASLAPNPNLTTTQQVRLLTPLPVQEGEDIALVNTKGPLKVRKGEHTVVLCVCRLGVHEP